MANAPAPPPPPPPAPPAPPAPTAPPVVAPNPAIPNAVGPLHPDTEAVALADATITKGGILTPEEAAAALAEARLAALDTSDVSQANAATGVYGDSGTGKTSQLATAAEYCWETYKRISHFYAADLGGYGNKMIKLMKLGIVRGYAPRNHVEAFETAELISMGYFPETILDPVIGYADPFVRLVPPQIRRWTIFCPNGHGFATTTNRKKLDGFQQQCPTCKLLVNLHNWSKVEEQIITSPGFKHVGLRLYDSGTSMQDWVMEDMAGKAAREEFGQGNQLKGSSGKVVSGEMVFGSNQMSHFGFAQNRMPSWIANSRRIPGNVVPPIWTFLEQRGKDEGNIVIFGPSIAGNARTSDVPSWLGNCLHLAKVPDASGKMINRIYLQNHSSPNEGNIPHLAKHRGDAGTMPEYLEDKQGEEPFTTCSLKYFFVRMEQALKTSLQAGVEQYPDAPALVGLADDDQEEVISTGVASLNQQVYQSPGVVGTVAGAVTSGASAAPMGVPAPPSGVPAPPPPAGVPAPPMAAPVAAPQPAQPVQAAPAGVPGPRPPVPTQPPPPVAAPPVVAPPPVVASPAAPVAPTPAAPAPSTGAPTPPPVQPTAAPQSGASVPVAQGGAPVRPPATSAVATPTARAARPPVPPPPGPPKS